MEVYAGEKCEFTFGNKSIESKLRWKELEQIDLEERGQGCIAKKRRYFLLHLTCRYICDILFNNKIINILLFTFIFWIISNRIFVQTILYLTWGFLLIKRRGVTNLQFT